MVGAANASARDETANGLIAPFLWDDIAEITDWRERIAWPVSGIFARALGEAVCREIMTRIAAIDDELDHQVAMVSAGSFVNGFVSLAEAAYVVQGEAQREITALGGPPELAAMRDGDATVEVLINRHRGKGIFDVTPASYPLLRSIVRSASWNSVSRLPLALIAPRSIVVTHNALLRRYAFMKGGRARYWPAANIIAKAQSRAAGKLDQDAGQALTETMAVALIPLAEGLVEPWRSRLLSLFRARLAPTIARISADVAAIRNLRWLPNNLWTGTGSAYVARVIACEVRRRGGTVTGFDHGGVTAISQASPITAIGELMVAARYCMGTERWANVLSQSESLSLAAPFGGCEIIHADGEPMFRQACIDVIARARRRVVYVGHPYRALRQFAIAGTPDVIYWDFQSRIAAYLAGLSIDFVCKPHPEGHFVGGRNPIEDIATTSYRCFEEHLPDTDVFVFDAPTSTTFAEALCTDRPVVLIERGLYPFNPAIESAVRARCRIVSSRIDERNRIWPDLEALEDAVLGEPESADPTYFRALLAGVPK